MQADWTGVGPVMPREAQTLLRVELVVGGGRRAETTRRLEREKKRKEEVEREPPSLFFQCSTKGKK